MAPGDSAAVELASGRVRAVVLPQRGAGLARFDAADPAAPGGWRPVFRPWDGASEDPNALACYLLVPWSNRLSGGVTVDGAWQPVAPTLPGERWPIHGWGWLSPWQVEHRDAGAVTLSHAADRPPWRYQARVTWAVDGATLHCSLSVTHHGPATVPYGLGLHPWLPRTAGTRLAAPAGRVWDETPDHLPAAAHAVADRPAWDFREPAPLPADWINAAFAGWSGRARIDWPEHGLGLTVAADRALGCYVLYSPGAEADFFCFEPVSHTVDAFNAPEGNAPEGNVAGGNAPGNNAPEGDVAEGDSGGDSGGDGGGGAGTRRLAPGESLNAAVAFTVARVEPT